MGAIGTSLPQPLAGPGGPLLPPGLPMFRKICWVENTIGIMQRDALWMYARWKSVEYGNVQWGPIPWRW